MVKDFSFKDIERVVYIWGRYKGTRDTTKEGKHYTTAEVKELAERLKRFSEKPESFNEGFEKEEEE